jgi:hypothetical protein
MARLALSYTIEDFASGCMRAEAMFEEQLGQLALEWSAPGEPPKASLGAVCKNL